jgi:hypothetical protein
MHRKDMIDSANAWKVLALVSFGRSGVSFLDLGLVQAEGGLRKGVDRRATKTGKVTTSQPICSSPPPSGNFKLGTPIQLLYHLTDRYLTEWQDI